MARKKRVLITGASGTIGSLLGRALADDYDLTGIDVRPATEMESVVADMTDAGAIKGAFANQDAVIDLAAASSADTPWDSVYKNNVVATYNALEAAREAGVKRLIFASSNHVTGMYETDAPYSSIVAGDYSGLDPSDIPMITTDMPIRPDGPYGIAKAFGEASGRYFSDNFELSVMCLRIGTLNRESRPSNPRQFATLLTHHDLVHLVDRCLSAPDEVRFGTFYGVSNNQWRFWDVSNATETVGYQPQDNAELWR
jgi:nucleoside-diphosphate-sugar epimerase